MYTVHNSSPRVLVHTTESLGAQINKYIEKEINSEEFKRKKTEIEALNLTLFKDFDEFK